LVYSAQMQEVIDKLRRAINDIEEEQDFSDDTLYGYIVDAVDELEFGRYQKGIMVHNGDFVRIGDSTPVVLSGGEKSLYSIAAHILLKTSLKDRADRENFVLKKNRLSVDTTKQSSDHGETLKTLQDRMTHVINNLKGHFRTTGVRVE